MTTTEQDLRRRVEAGETHGQIAASLGMCRTHVASACAVLGIKRPRKAKPANSPRPPVIPTTSYGVDSSELLRAMAGFARPSSRL
ncbi:MAG: hypothetical protein RL758_165 [Pseudomonadota bacterium]|jgi:hypothetical protein